MELHTVKSDRAATRAEVWSSACEIGRKVSRALGGRVILTKIRLRLKCLQKLENWNKSESSVCSLDQVQQYASVWEVRSKQDAKVLPRAQTKLESTRKSVVNK